MPLKDVNTNLQWRPILQRSSVMVPSSYLRLFLFVCLKISEMTIEMKSLWNVWEKTFKSSDSGRERRMMTNFHLTVSGCASGNGY
jgi:hypothetical protein